MMPVKNVKNSGTIPRGNSTNMWKKSITGDFFLIAIKEIFWRD